MDERTDRIPCPHCSHIMVVSAAMDGRMGRCSHCRAPLQIRMNTDELALLKVEAKPEPADSKPAVPSAIDPAVANSDSAPLANSVEPRSGFLRQLWETTFPIVIGLFVSVPLGAGLLWQAGMLPLEREKPQGAAAVTGEDPPADEDRSDVVADSKLVVQKKKTTPKGALPNEISPLDPTKVIVDPVGGVYRVKDELLVTLAPGKQADDIFEVLDDADIKAKVVGRIPNRNEFQIELDADSLSEALTSLRKHKDVANACYNFIVRADRTFQDKVLVDNDRQNDWGLRMVGASKAWQVATGKGVKIAIVDSGCKLDHPDIKGKVDFSYSFATRGPTMQQPDACSVLDRLSGRHVRDFVSSHGTHVAVTAAGTGNNDGEAIGVAPDAKLFIVQVLSFDPSSKSIGGTSATTRAGIYGAIASGADVINLSLGPVFDDETVHRIHLNDPQTIAKLRQFARDHLSASYQPLLKEARKHNVILVRAAGNDEIPADFDPLILDPNVISVAAVDSSGRRVSFSNYGNETTVSAPGDDIYSGHSDPRRPYQLMSGTSMAAPHVTGIVALMRELKPKLTAAEAIRILKQTGRPAKHEPDKPIGPIVDAAAALEAIKPDAFGILPIAKWKLPRPTPDIGNPPGTIEWMPDGQHLVSASRDKNVQLLQIDTSSKISVKKQAAFKVTRADDYRGMSVAPDGKAVALVARIADNREDGFAIQVWSLPDLKPQGEIVTIDSYMAGFSPDSTKFATYGELGILGEVKSTVWMQWDTKTGKRLGVNKRTGDTFSVPLPRDGYVATMGSGKEWIIAGWTDSKQVGTLISEKQWESMKVVMMNSRVGLARIGLMFGDTRIFQSPIVTSNDLSLAAFCHGTTLFVHNLKDGSLVKSAQLSEKSTSLDMSEDGSRLLSGTMDGRVVLWETRTLKQLVEYGDHPEWIYEIRFSPDGRRAFTVSKDYVLRIIPIPSK